jgi:hypothetical protein
VASLSPHTVTCLQQAQRKFARAGGEHYRDAAFQLLTHLALDEEAARICRQLIIETYQSSGRLHASVVGQAIGAHLRSLGEPEGSI